MRLEGLCGDLFGDGFNWTDNRFALVKFIMVNPLKDLP